MDSTTLVTFLYHAPRHVSRVELFGSWDNFSKPYPMQRDNSVSSRNWKGCHSFSDIVCDGDLVAMDGSTRDGALQMGGTYWYYYRLDDETECHDPTVDSTRGCPFLPGQEVNVLEVPVQEVPIVCSSTTSLLDVFTLDPAAKFTSAKHSVSASGQDSISPSKESKVNRALSLKESFLSTIPRFTLARSKSTPNRKCMTASQVTASRPEAQTRPFTQNAANEFINDSTIPTHHDFAQLSPVTSAEPQTLSDTVDGSRPHSMGSLNLDDASSIYSGDASSLKGFNGDELMSQDATTSDHHRPRSNRTSGVFSLLSDSAVNSPLSTNRHSFNAQPDTPLFPTFDSFTLEPLQLDLPSWGNNSETKESLPQSHDHLGPYLHSEKEHASAITLRPSATPFKELNHTARLSPLEKLDLVESWRHGESPSTVPEAEPSALQELINDLGYLSSMIA